MLKIKAKATNQLITVLPVTFSPILYCSPQSGTS